MKKAFLALALYIATCSYAHSEPLVLRSGEHETFTRVVLPLPEDARWSMENLPGNSRLSFEGFSDGFDLSYAFEIIPRTRLKALVGRPSELVMQLSCDCPVSTFIERDRFLVIDILDGPPLDMPTDEVPARTSLPSSGFLYGELLWAGNSARSEAVASYDFEQPDELSLENRSSVANAAESEILRSTQERLIEGFSSAVSSGLIQPKQNVQPPQPDSEQTEPAITPYDSSAIAQEIALSPEGHIRITNSKDVPETQRMNNLGSSGAICPDPDAFDVSSWGSDKEFATQIAASNIELMDDLGRMSKKKVLDRARLYIYFGFGAEAKQTLQFIPSLLTENPEIIDLANIMELGHSHDPHHLSRYADCDSNIALWAVLADKEISKEQAIDANAALRALNELPSHLKFFLAQILSNRLLEMGDKESAKIAIRFHEKLEENVSDDPTMADARVADLQNDEDGFKEILTEILDGQSTETPEAIAAIVQNHVDQQTSVPADLALLAESYAFEFKGTELGHEMLRTFILASTKSAQFEKVFAILEDNDRMSAFDDATRSDLVSFVFSEFSKEAEDADFLKGVFSEFPKLNQHIENEVFVELSGRLVDLGFAEQATSLLSQASPDFQSKNLSLLKAKLFLLSGQYNEGLAEIADIEGPEVAKLRGELMQMLGNYKEAASYFEEANMPERALSSRWLSGNWSDEIPETTPIFGALSQLKKEKAMEPLDRQNMLARTGEAISSSSEARLTLQESLNSLERPATTD